MSLRNHYIDFVRYYYCLWEVMGGRAKPNRHRNSSSRQDSQSLIQLLVGWLRNLSPDRVACGMIQHYQDFAVEVGRVRHFRASLLCYFKHDPLRAFYMSVCVSVMSSVELTKLLSSVVDTIGSRIVVVFQATTLLGTHE